MEIKFIKRKLLNQIENLGKIINNSNYLQSLKGIFFQVEENEIKVTSSNGNLSIKKIIKTNEEIKIIEPGVFLVPGKLFIEVLKKHGNEIKIKKMNGNLSIKSVENESFINLFDELEYPNISFEINNNKEFLIEKEILKKAINNVSFASAENDKRIILNGVNLKSSNGFLELSATNSYRLAYEKIKINNDLEFNISILSRDLKNFINNESQKTIKINVENSKIITSFENTYMALQIIDGIYPDVKNLIPQDFSKEIKIDKKLLDDLINRVMVMSSENNKVVVLSVNQEKLSLKTEKNEIGKTISETKLFDYIGEEFEITFNLQFLKDAINIFEGNISLSFNGNQEPFVIKSETNDNLIQLVLPHRVY